MDGGMLSTSPDDASAPPLQSSSAAPMEEAADEDDDGPGAPPLGAAGARAGAPSGGGGAKPKRSRAASAREMTEQQKDERRERNREHAKRSRVRKKFLLESLQQSVNALQYENDKLRVAIRDKMGDAVANELLARCGSDGKKTSLIARDPSDATRILDDPDYSLVKALQTAQQNFVITDPSLPDNPIVSASPGFLEMTGYQLSDVRELEGRVDQSLVSAPILEPEVRGSREGEADRR